MAFEADTTQDILQRCFNASLSTLQVSLKGGGLISFGAVRIMGTASAIIQGTTTYGLEVDVGRLPNNVRPNISSIQDNISSISDWEAAQSTAVVSIGLHSLLEAADVDGAALPNPVTEGSGTRAKGTLWGVQLVMPVSKDGSKSYPSRDRLATVELQSATTITAAETVIGNEIDISLYNTVTIFVDYTLGDETSYDIIPKVLRVTSGNEHAYGTWSSGATKSFAAEKFRFTASGKHYITLDITGLDIIKIYGDATGGTPTGTVQVGYTLSNN